MLDAKWGTAPWMTLAGILVGAGLSFFNMFRVLAWLQKHDSDDESGSGT